MTWWFNRSKIQDVAKRLTPVELDVFLRQERILADLTQLQRMAAAAQILLKQQIRDKYQLSDSFSIIHESGELVEDSATLPGKLNR